MNKVYAVDFDGTLCESAYPNIGAVKEHIIEHFKQLKDEGNTLILWTCRNGERLNEAIDWCEERGLFFDHINENLPANIDKYGEDTRKVWADYYVDDKNIDINTIKARASAEALQGVSKLNKFWNFKNLDEGAEMRLEGVISEDTWWGDEVTPKIFKDELAEYEGKDLTIWINSPGGDVFAASVIYTAIKERKGSTKVKIDGMAASAASVIAMSGDSVEMSPTAILMIHNPWTIAGGDEHELKKTIAVLKEVKETIINAYELKSGQSRDEISKLMDKETWMNAHEAVRLGFADAVLYTEGTKDEAPRSMAVNHRHYMAQICAKIKNTEQIDANTEGEPNAQDPSSEQEPEQPTNTIDTDAILKYLDLEEGLYQ